MIGLMKGPATCVPFLNDATQAVTSAALEAGNRIANLMPELTLKWDFLSILLLKPQKLFCKEIYTTPNFENSPCTDQLGCGTAGQGPPDETEVEMVPPEQVPAPIVRRPTSTPAPSCGSLRMGDRFIELGKFRIAEIDASHLSISHKDHAWCRYILNHVSSKSKQSSWPCPVKCAVSGHSESRCRVAQRRKRLAHPQV